MFAFSYFFSCPKAEVMGVYFSSEEAAGPALLNVTLVQVLWLAPAAAAEVDVALGVHHTSPLTSKAQKICALLRGQLSSESGCFSGGILFVLPSGDTLASSDTLILSSWEIWHLLLKTTMLGKGTERFLMYSDQSSAKIPVLESAFLCSLLSPTTWSVHHGCCADGEGSNPHHLRMGISPGSSETWMSDALEEFCCLVWDVPWTGRLPVPSACGSPVGLCVLLLCWLTWTELLHKLISAGSCFCTAWQGRVPVLGLYFCKAVPHPALCACAHNQGSKRRDPLEKEFAFHTNPNLIQSFSGGQCVWELFAGFAVMLRMAHFLKFSVQKSKVSCNLK